MGARNALAMIEALDQGGDHLKNFPGNYVAHDYDLATFIQALESNDEEALKHFGVLGMKWGVHRRRELHANRMGDLDKVGTYKNDTGDTRSVLGKTPERKKREIAGVSSDVKKFRSAMNTNSNEARNQRQILKDQLKQRTLYNPAYRKAFDKELAKQEAAKNDPNPDYNDGMRRHDKLRFSAGSVKRINQSMNEGLDHRTAAKKEQRRKEIQTKITAGLTVTAVLLNALGPSIYSDVRDTIGARAATNRDKRAQAREEFIRNGPQKPDTKNAKKNFRGVYNVTTM